MKDKVFEHWLTRQYEDGMALARNSDILELLPLDGTPPERYLARFRCKGLVKREDGEIVEADRFEVGIWFHRDHLRRVDPAHTVAWLSPPSIWHPNIAYGLPFICLGRLLPGTGLVDILYQVFEIVTYRRVTMREDDCLNPPACSWARNNQHRFPIDRRGLKRRRVEMQISVQCQET